MVLGIQPSCMKCQCTESVMWHKNEKEQVYCQKCFDIQADCNGDTAQDNEIECGIDAAKSDKKENDEYSQSCSTNIKEEEETDLEKEKDSKCNDKKDSRRKTRKGKQGAKGNIPKGKGRRYIFKKSTSKTSVAVSTPITSNYIFHQGNYYQVGDIVSLIDIDGGTYYAQIRGLLQDQYCEKSAVLTWLVPTKNSPPPEERFEPSTYIIGPEEDIPRKLEYMRFVCHAPSDYYKDKSSPYATISYQPQSCFIWSKLGPVIKPVESVVEILGK